VATERARQRVLVVEDSADIAEALTVVLQTEGYDVVCATTRNQAVALLDDSIDYIICDYLMEGVGVAPFLAAVRVVLGRDLPVILCTAHADGKLEATRLGLDFLAKPFEPDDVSKLLAARKAARATTPN